MYARVDFNGYLGETLNYNEKKVEQEDAELIHAENYLIDKDRMNFYEKFDALKNLNELRPDVNVNTLHAKVSFHPDDELTTEKLKDIAQDYMKGLGYEKQPYLVYQHFDSGQPHLHIVSTIIQSDGERIPTHNVGKLKSNEVRKELEKKYNLIPADGRKEQEVVIKAVDVQAVEYGKKSSKDAMKNAILVATRDYKTTSLGELNALLRLYNVNATQGEEGSRTHQHDGLYYRILKEDGQVAGKQIKASAFYFKPTMKNLKADWEENKTTREKDKNYVRDKLNWALAQKPGSIDEYIDLLKKENIDVTAWKNDKGLVYGVTYIDHDRKAVINGRDVGKEFAAAALLKKFNLESKSLDEATSQDLSKVAGQKENQVQESSTSQSQIVPNSTSPAIIDPVQAVPKTQTVTEQLPVQKPAQHQTQTPAHSQPAQKAISPDAAPLNQKMDKKETVLKPPKESVKQSRERKEARDNSSKLNNKVPHKLGSIFPTKNTGIDQSQEQKQDKKKRKRKRLK